jgi:hypothetical protein
MALRKKQPTGPKLIKGQELETPDREAAAVSEPTPLFSEAENGRVEQDTEWFYRRALRTVEVADKLVAAVTQRVSPNERSGLDVNVLRYTLT